MTEPVQLALIASIPSVLSAITLWRQRAMEKDSKVSRVQLHEAVVLPIQDLARNTNGMKEALVAAVGITKRAEGVVAGLEQAKNDYNANAAIELKAIKQTVSDITKTQ